MKEINKNNNKILNLKSHFAIFKLNYFTTHTHTYRKKVFFYYSWEIRPINQRILKNTILIKV